MANVTLRPGKVIQVLDSGYIKVEAPGLFDREDSENSPEIRPWYTGGTNAFSQPKEGEWVWVLNASDNPQQLYWFRKDNHEENNGILEMLDDVEVLCNKPTAKGNAQLYYSNDTGWFMGVNSSGLQVGDEGNIKMDNHCGAKIEMNGAQLLLGDEPTEPCVKGNKLVDLLSQISQTLKSIRSAAAGNYITGPIAAAISGSPEYIDDIKTDILSDNIKIT